MTARFPLPLQAELQDDGKKWRLLAPFSFLDPAQGWLDVPAGFVTDFASTRPLRTIAVCGFLLAQLLTLLPWPWLSPAALLVGVCALILYAAVVGYGHPAAALHDWLYATGQLPRAAADAAFRQALLACGVARWRSWLMWAGVRLGGARRYRPREVEPDPPLPQPPELNKPPRKRFFYAWRSAK
jgi:hypothetical protein